MSKKKPLPVFEEPRAERCETCRFWDDGITKAEIMAGRRSSCHRHAPAPLTDGNSPPYSYIVWPCTAPIDWCGEWKAKEINRSAILDKPIAELGLSIRSANCLAVADIVTIGDLCKKQLWELLTIKHFGGNCPNEVRTRLALLGLSLKGESEK